MAGGAVILVGVVGYAMLERSWRQTAEANAAIYAAAAEVNRAALHLAQKTNEEADLAFAAALSRAMKLGAGIEAITQEIRNDEGSPVADRIRAHRDRLLGLAIGSDRDGGSQAGAVDPEQDSGPADAGHP